MTLNLNWYINDRQYVQIVQSIPGRARRIDFGKLAHRSSDGLHVDNKTIHVVTAAFRGPHYTHRPLLGSGRWEWYCLSECYRNSIKQFLLCVRRIRRRPHTCRCLEIVNVPVISNKIFPLASATSAFDSTPQKVIRHFKFELVRGNPSKWTRVRRTKVQVCGCSSTKPPPKASFKLLPQACTT